VRSKRFLSQVEICQILRKVALGLKDIWALNIIHRDLKLANLLLDFPDNPELNNMEKTEKIKFLRTFDFSSGKGFRVVISDFGLSTILIPGSQGQQSICGTPLYSAPQLLRKRNYTYKVDVWALGIMCFEMIMGKTPFHSYEMKDLIQKINRGDYMLKLEEEAIALEAALFLSQTL